MKGLFTPEPPARSRTVPRSARCGACGLSKGCQSPKMPVTGKGRRRVLIVAEAPGRQEDQENIQLIGDAGQKLRKILKGMKIDLDRDCWKTNALCCYVKGNPEPTDRQIGWCRPNLMKAVRELKPDVIVLLGAVAVDSLLGVLWKEKPGPIGQWVGWQIPSQELNTWICPTYHPSYLLRTRDPVAELMVTKHLKAAFGLEGRPWNEIPDYRGMIRCEKSSSEAASILRSVKGGSFAFDFETNMLKPDHPDARIVCCSVCWGDELTIAFPWHGEAVAAMGKLLAGFEQKVGWSIKFEDRWTRKAFAFGVNNWLYCGMNGSHVLDNRRGITSAKFQAFVRLGLAPYDREIKPYLEAKDSNTLNRIDEVDLDDLLMYCGMDSLVEYRICEQQTKEMES